MRGLAAAGSTLRHLQARACMRRGACDVLERAFNYAWMAAGLSLDVPPNSAPPTLLQQQRRVRAAPP